ncbi:hypothetical protein KA005_26785 [bacterium]|nr:hypothetical protein [bacterium]
MKKIFSLFVVTFFAVAIMAPAAFAGYIESKAGAALTGADLNAADGDVDDVTVASEKIVAAYTLDFSAAGVLRAIIYSPSTDLASGSHIWFKLTNAEWDTTKNIYLVGDAISGNHEDAKLYGSTDAYADESGTLDDHYCKIITGADITAGTELYLHMGAAPPVNTPTANTVFDIDGAAGLIVPPTIEDFEISQGAAGTVQISATRAQFAGDPIIGGQAAAEDIVTASLQFEWALDATAGVNNSVIDVDPADAADSRKVLVASDPNANEAPTTTQSVCFNVLFTDNAPDDKITLIAADKLNVELTAQYDLNDYVLDAATAPVIAYDLDEDDAMDAGEEFTIDAVNGMKAAISLAGNVVVAGNTDSLLIEVTGTDTLNPQTITAKVELALDDENYTSSLFSGDAFEWGINGAQVVVPYLNSDTVNYGTYVLINNTSTLSGDIRGDVYTDGGAAQLASDVDFGTIDAKSTLLLTASEIQTKVEDAGITGVARYMIKFIITTPGDNTFVTAFQINGSGGGKRAVPTYKWQGGQWCE